MTLYNMYKYIAIKLRVCSGAHHGRLQHPLHPGGQAAQLRAGEGEGGLLDTKLQTTIVSLAATWYIAANMSILSNQGHTM